MDEYNIEHDWLLTKKSGRLHYARITPAQLEYLSEQGLLNWGGPLKLLCGIHILRVFVPGVLERMTTERCRRCCKMLKYPKGFGSPKNDPACREILGLPPKDPGTLPV
jgi:hypothetical protein